MPYKASKWRNSRWPPHTVPFDRKKHNSEGKYERIWMIQKLHEKSKILHVCRLMDFLICVYEAAVVEVTQRNSLRLSETYFTSADFLSNTDEKMVFFCFSHTRKQFDLVNNMYNSFYNIYLT